jgi:hypothetical protein
VNLEDAITQAVRAAVRDELRSGERIAVTLEPRLYSGSEARALLGISNDEFYAAVNRGDLRAIRRGSRNWQISSVALFEFISQLEGRTGVLRLQTTLQHAAD